jgi:CheY-like chemotaxis protein
MPSKHAATMTKPADKSSTRLPDDELPLVLLADDDYDNREMYSGYLRANGFRVAAARDGAQAVRLARQLRPAIVVLDVQMPRVDGIAAARTIRRDEKLHDTPILVVTAYDAEEQEALNAGANAVCVKPCIPADLIVLIQQLLPDSAMPSTRRQVSARATK